MFSAVSSIWFRGSGTMFVACVFFLLGLCVDCGFAAFGVVRFWKHTLGYWVSGFLGVVL